MDPRSTDSGAEAILNAVASVTSVCASFDGYVNTIIKDLAAKGPSSETSIVKFFEPLLKLG